MLSFEEFVVQEAPKRIASQQMGYDNKDSNHYLWHMFNNEGSVLPKKFNGFDIHKLTKNNIIRIGILDNSKETVIYESIFEKQTPKVVRQTAVWRDENVKGTRGIINYVIFELILKEYTLMSDVRQTNSGNDMWKRLFKTAISKGYHCNVVDHTNGNVTSLDSDKDFDNASKDESKSYAILQKGLRSDKG